MIKIDEKVTLSGLIDTRNAVHTHLDDQYNTIRTKHPDNDLLYGPYNSLIEAFNSLAEKNAEGIDALVVGKTVGVLINGIVREYWFERKCENVFDLVLKNTNAKNLQVGEVDDKTLILSIKNIYTDGN